VLCVVAHEYDLPALGRLFSVAPQRTSDLRFFGDFILRGDVTLSDLRPLYSLDLGSIDDQMSLGAFVASRIGGKPVIGDHFEWSGLVWTVVELEGNQVLKVGVKPAAPKSPKASVPLTGRAPREADQSPHL
jgi:cell volume regulation protein A